MEDDKRGAWQIAVGLGWPDPSGPGSLDNDEIHPIALLLEESAHRVRGVNRIPCYTGFGPVGEILDFAVRLCGNAYDPAAVPVECTLTVYATQDELDELLQAVVEDLGVSKDGYSVAAGRKVTLGLRDVSPGSQEDALYQHLVDRYRNRAD
ncbi:hypothetical protein [Nocardia transvalensis]|uniref:hypothetical protein n=1 Tax=Nocardia transvalensis TaxID=37333 RepID=UPI001893D70C|nr:hypothetical protein [Nocardia transvalensis]MBF6330946.1 hypothetical protein [Nocardia transvalensis]